MNTIVGKYWKFLLSIVFALIVFMFWAYPYRSVLSYQEQYQMFLFDGDYFADRIRVPGGLADYVAEFITQFNYLYVVGALLVALLFFLLQRLTAVVFRRCGVDGGYYPLTFIPVLILWAYMGNENVLLSFALSLLMAEEAMLHYVITDDHTSSVWSRIAYQAVALPLFYWLFGASVWVVVAFIFLYELLKHRNIGLALFGIVYTVSIILLCAQFLQYPLYKLFGGINYFRYPGIILAMQWVVMAVFGLMPVICTLLPDLKKRKALVSASLGVIIAVLGGLFVKFSFVPLTYDMIEYDYLVRSHQYGKIIEKAREKQPVSPLGVSCVNFALAMQGQLLDHMFEFYQNGAEGLFPTFTRDMTSTLPTSEIFYQLGMVNDAERYTFEAQEAIPNYRKSGRLTKRLAQCEIVNGNYRVAAKYLRMLQKTLFYSDWADSQMRFIGNDKAVSADEEYGRLRDIRIKGKDYLFSDQEMDQMIGLMLVDNKKFNNRMAYEYLIAYELLQRDIQRFMQYYPLGQYVNLDHIPYSTQQVLIGTWLQKHPSLDGMPYSVDQQNVQGTVAFIRAYMTDKKAPALHEPPLCYNVWHYLLMSSSKKKGKEKMRDIY